MKSKMKQKSNIITIFFLFFLIKPLLCFSEERIAIVTELAGNVLMQEKGSFSWEKVDENMPLSEGDKIKTKKGASAEITFIEDGHILRVEENTYLEIKDFKENKKTTTLWLSIGKVLSYLEKSLSPSSLIIKTPTAILGVRSTEFAVETTKEETEVATYSGNVSVRGLTKDGYETEEILLSSDMQTKIGRFKIPEQPHRMQKKWAELKERFPHLHKKLAILKGNWNQLTPEERQNIKQKLRDFKKLPPEERKEALKELKQKVREKKEEMMEKREEMKERKKENIMERKRKRIKENMHKNR